MEFRGRRIMRNIHKNVLPDQAQFCVTCLRTDCKLYPFTQYSLGEAYELLTGNSLQQEVRFTSKFCTECAHRLTSCRKFRARSLQAYDALAELAQMHDVLTTEDIKSINNKYSSCLSYSDVTLTLVTPERNDSSATNQQDVKVEPKVEHIKSEAGEELSDDEGDKDSGNLNDVDVENVEKLHENVKNTVKAKRGNIDTAKPKTKRKPKIKKGYKTSAEVQEMMKLFHLNKLTIEEQLADIQKRKESSNYKNSVYKCDVCFKGFASQNTYETHLKMHTTEYGQFLCEICKVYTKSASALRLHCKESHSTTYNCVSCPFVTKQKCSAVSHARWHTGVKYKCELCTEEYDKKTSLLSHVRLSHPSDVACPFCGYCFVNQCGLRKHLEMKHRFDSAQEVTGPLCGECDIRFASEAAFQQHVLVSPKHNTNR
ncbi:zinc finger protein 81 [Bicyclus anynana]|uniref:Zinc finger protein 81 n=1 Tax=Bicyclus anynana TaxID=110368 RepID=A0ABM3M604_BICAN|nr:zinc finger protein 81 [Bicyclus anynana]